MRGFVGPGSEKYPLHALQYRGPADTTKQEHCKNVRMAQTRGQLLGAGG